jgi:hypothetical protein
MRAKEASQTGIVLGNKFKSVDKLAGYRKIFAQCHDYWMGVPRRLRSMDTPLAVASFAQESGNRPARCLQL